MYVPVHTGRHKIGFPQSTRTYISLPLSFNATAKAAATATATTTATKPTSNKMEAQKMHRGTDAMKAHLEPSSNMEGT
jgi:hypothetical protein